MTRRTWPRPISTSLSARASTRKKTPARTCAPSRRSDATTRAGAAAGRSSRSATARDANRRSALPRKRHAQSRRVEEIVALAAGRGIVLEAVEFVVVETGDEEARADVMVVGNAAADRPGGRRCVAIDERGGRDGSEAERRLIVARGAVRGEAGRERPRLGVAGSACETKT